MHVHQEDYTHGHVSLYCYEDGYTTAVLPKREAWDRMKEHYAVWHGEQNGSFEKVSHGKVLSERSGRGLSTPAVGRRGSFVGNDVFPQTAPRRKRRGFLGNLL